MDNRTLYDPQNFKRLVLDRFQFLQDEYGFRKRKELTQVVLQIIPYTNKTTFVNIVFDKRDTDITVYLAPVVAGRGALDYTFDTNAFSLGTLLELRAPHIQLLPDVEGFRYFYDSEIEEIVTNSANALRLYAADILQGDFSVLPQVKPLKANTGDRANINAAALPISFRRGTLMTASKT